MFYLHYLIIFILAIVIIYFFVKNNLETGKFLNLLDIPKTGKIHKNITPLIGSFPIVIFSLILLFYSSAFIYYKEVFYIFVYSYVYFLLGYIDDRYGLNAYLKLSISTIIMFLVLDSLQIFQIKEIYILTIDKKIFLGGFDLFFSVLCVLLLMNALNLMDGINGLASSFATIWVLLLTFFINDKEFFIVMIALTAFMMVNTIFIIKGIYFLGDSGTLFLGSLVGIFTIFTYNNQIILNNVIPVEIIFILFMIPGIDMFRLFLTRLFKKKDPFGGDLNHMHHFLIKRFSLKLCLLCYFSIFLITSTIGYFQIIKPITIIILYILLYVLFIYYSEKKLKNTF